MVGFRALHDSRRYTISRCLGPSHPDSYLFQENNQRLPTRRARGRAARGLAAQPLVVDLCLFSVMEPDDNPFRRPAGGASINSTSCPKPLPAVAADAVDGTGQRQCGCAMLAEANATAQRSITVGADVLGSLETQRAQLISTQGTLAEQQSDLNREGYVETKPCMAGQRGPTG